MRCILLGSGTSTGVPEVGCHCRVCRSEDRHDKRTRTSLLIITDAGKQILIDCSPDFRQQALFAGIDSLDAVLLTHEHFDHVGGLDDLRTICWHRELAVYAEQNVLDSIRDRLHYVFRKNPYPGTPLLKLCEVKPDMPFQVADLTVEPLRIMHGRLPILGYKIGKMAFLTDMKDIAAEEIECLKSCRLLFINGLRYRKEHPSHQTIEQAIDTIGQIGNPESVLIHLSHHAPLHQEHLEILPPHIHSGYDGLEAIIDEKGIRIKDFEPHVSRSEYHYQDCGRIGYESALTLQRKLFHDAVADKLENRKPQNTLLFCEHEPVLTLGKHGHEENLLLSESELKSRDIRLFHIERGGDITYHGPGQITGYPIFDLEQYGIGLRTYIEMLEQCIIDLIAIFGLKGERSAGASGVWLDPDIPGRARKICAIGVKSSRHITMHGFALNVNTDLDYFKLINPCGFSDRGVTSISRELGREQDFILVKQQLEAVFRRNFGAL
ncbi:MBL fold metallo-hydrolase [Porphyromonas gingivalis]|uniref:MBL fold metallo-hydrolase n=1 Tax=Porphyromonas gingivalis TaxID=837 RepID=UPI0021D4238B|nr:MBL fold metallo-hydrolase [Porphyromonas gingivalis]MCE8189301.1 MBL fold metallo-hydrolase [Porphyromonas gingivalis]